jgi:hypothetical protein
VLMAAELCFSVAKSSPTQAATLVLLCLGQNHRQQAKAWPSNLPGTASLTTKKHASRQQLHLPPEQHTH